MLNRVTAEDYNLLKLIGLQGGSFYMLLECDDGTFIHENLDGSIKEYRKADDALNWVKRATDIREVIVEIDIWNDDRVT